MQRHENAQEAQAAIPMEHIEFEGGTSQRSEKQLLSDKGSAAAKSVSDVKPGSIAAGAGLGAKFKIGEHLKKMVADKKAT